MNNCYLEAILIGSIIFATAVSTSSAETRWNRVAPQGAGFSIEAPSEPRTDAESVSICLRIRVLVSCGQAAAGRSDHTGARRAPRAQSTREVPGVPEGQYRRRGHGQAGPLLIR